MRRKCKGGEERLSPAVRVKHMQMMTVLFSLHGVSFGVSNVK